MKRQRIFWATIALLVCAGGIALLSSAKRDTAPNLPEEPHEWAGFQKRLEALPKESPRFSLFLLGEVNYPKTRLSIKKLSFAPESTPAKRVLLTAGVHGDEPAGVELLLQFAERLAREPQAYPGIAFDIVPLVNPWGWLNNKRRNGHHQDLNRDFASFKAPEAIIMRDSLSPGDYDLIIDFHEDDTNDGFYFYRLDSPDFALCRQIIDAIKAENYPVQSGRIMTIFSAKDGVITSGRLGLRLARLARQFSMSNYFRMEGCPMVFLFETPDKLPLETRVKMARIGLDVLLTKLLGSQ